MFLAHVVFQQKEGSKRFHPRTQWTFMLQERVRCILCLLILKKNLQSLVEQKVGCVDLLEFLQGFHVRNLKIEVWKLITVPVSCQ